MFTVPAVPRISTFLKFGQKIGPKSDPRVLKIDGGVFFLGSRLWSNELNINISIFKKNLIL